MPISVDLSIICSIVQDLDLGQVMQHLEDDKVHLGDKMLEVWKFFPTTLKM